MSELQEHIKEVYDLLRPYQKDVLKRMVQDKRHLNYMDMGMGKTLVTMTAVLYTQAFPCIIVCPKSAMGVWQDELRKWFSMDSILYVGKPKERKQLWKEFIVEGHKFIITNYTLVKELAELFGIVPGVGKKGSSKSGTTKANITPHPGTLHVGSIIADEIQLSGLFNHKTQTYALFHKMARVVPNIYPLTGTPFRRGVVDFYGPLSIVAPEEFDSYWKFVNKYCISINTGYGKSIERNPKDIPAFRDMLRKYATILKKEDYLHELPGKIRQAIPIEMDDEQKRVYRELMEDMFAETDTGELIMTPSVLALSVRLRQLLVCPQELGLSCRGTAIDTIIEMSEPLIEEGKPFVIFTPFKRAIKWIRQALEDTYSGVGIYEIAGGLTAEEFTRAWQGFQNDSHRQRRVLICVIKSGASFHATCSGACFFLGYEWDFNQNAQAEDRLNRMGQQSLVSCYYPMYKGTIDEDIALRLNDKKFNSDLILAGDDVFKMLWNRIRGTLEMGSGCSLGNSYKG